jgi:hypothetical protein
MAWDQLQEALRSGDLTVEQKMALAEQHRLELERRVELVEALLDAVRSRDEMHPHADGGYL